MKLAFSSESDPIPISPVNPAIMTNSQTKDLRADLTVLLVAKVQFLAISKNLIWWALRDSLEPELLF